MRNYAIELIPASSVKDGISPLGDVKDVWRVTSDGDVVAYCLDKALADRIARHNLYRPRGNPFRAFVVYPSPESPTAMCVGLTNFLLHQDDSLIHTEFDN